MSLEEFKKNIEDIEITYDYDETYTNLRNTTIDYMNESQDWDFDRLFEDIVDEEIVEEMAKHELEEGGLARLYYFMGDVNPNCESIFRIDGYGNLASIDKDDLSYIKDEILEEIDRKLEDELEV